MSDYDLLAESLVLAHKNIDDLQKRVLELERRVYGYDLTTKEPLPPHTPKGLRVK